MPVKLIAAIVLIVLVTIFAGFNVHNFCNISLIFCEIKDVPVFITVLISFVLGALIAIPFTLSSRKNKNSTKDIKAPSLKNEKKQENKSHEK